MLRSLFLALVLADSGAITSVYIVGQGLNPKFGRPALLSSRILLCLISLNLAAHKKITHSSFSLGAAVLLLLYGRKSGTERRKYPPSLPPFLGGLLPFGPLRFQALHRVCRGWSEEQGRGLTAALTRPSSARPSITSVRGPRRALGLGALPRWAGPVTA